MSADIQNEQELNDGFVELNQQTDNEMQASETNESPRPPKKKYHSSALYAASMWHNTVKRVKPPHPGGSFLPLQA